MALSILIIDDDASFRHLVELRIRKIDPVLNIKAFENLTTARAFLRENNPTFDLVVLDQHLPDGRGLDLLKEGALLDLAVLAVSSDDNPQFPGATIQAGATFFLNKMHISEPLFEPLVRGIIDRNRLFRELLETRVKSAKFDTIKTLVSTLRHEINNPLGAVMGAAFLVKTSNQISPDQKQAAEIIETSGQRIKFVLKQLCDAALNESELINPVEKGQEKVFHVPGDKAWKDSSEK